MSGKSKSQFPADVDCPRESKKVCIVSNHADDEGLPEIVYLECNEGGSNKFYQIVRNIEEVSISYGKKGFAGTSSIKKFGNEEDAKSYLQKMKSEKLKKGYRDNGEVIASEISNNNISSIDESKSIDATTPSTTVLNGVSETAYLECVVGTSRKFYKLSRKLSQVEITYGRIGDKGVLSVKEFDNVDEALRFVHKTSAEKQKKGYKLISTTDASTLEDTFTLDEDLVVPSKDVDAVATSSTSVHESNDIKKIHLECTENGSDKFYTLTLEGTAVTSSYGRKGTNGTTSVKRFDKMSDALAFMNKTKGEKIRKGYREQANSSQLEPLSGVRTVKEDPVERLADLENGLKVYVQGSSAMPYTCKKFEGGYSCSCQGWGMTVKNKGVQATTCKHLKSIRGEEAEAVRCNEAAGICNPSAKGLRSAGIPGKIALAHQWKDSIDPTGFLMSEKLDGMRAYWTGEKLFTRSGLPILCPDWFLSAFPRNLELDGELFLGRKQFEQCMSITRRTDKGGDWTRISYVVFDAPTVKDGISTRLQVAAASIEEGTFEQLFGLVTIVLDGMISQGWQERQGAGGYQGASSLRLRGHSTRAGGASGCGGTGRRGADAASPHCQAP